MEESSESTWTAAVNLISFATNRRDPLEWDPILTGKVCIPLMIASAEVERVLFICIKDFGVLALLNEVIRSSPTISSFTLGYCDMMEKPQIIPALASALRDAKSLRKLRVNTVYRSLGGLNALVELLDPKSNLQISLNFDYLRI